MHNPRRSSLVILFATTFLMMAFGHSLAHASGMYQVTDLGPVPLGYGEPIVNASGQVVQDPSGSSLATAGTYSIRNEQGNSPSGSTQTNIYQNGSLIASLNTLVGDPKFDTVLGYAVNKSGMVVGSEQTYSLLGPLGIAYYYTPSGGMHAIPQLYPSSNALTAALSINDAGMIVGSSTGPGGFNDPTRKAYISDGQTSWDLNTLIGTGSGLTLTSATDISDSGLITGFAVDSKGQENLFLLTPTATPEPSVLLILGAGLMGFGVRKVSRAAKPVALDGQ